MADIASEYQVIRCLWNFELVLNALKVEIGHGIVS